jgi:hypothetical protein
MLARWRDGTGLLVFLTGAGVSAATSNEGLSGEMRSRLTCGRCGAWMRPHVPYAIGTRCARNGAPIVDINPEPNPFSELSERNGTWLREGASSGLAKVARLLGVE